MYCYYFKHVYFDTLHTHLINKYKTLEIILYSNNKYFLLTKQRVSHPVYERNKRWLKNRSWMEMERSRLQESIPIGFASNWTSVDSCYPLNSVNLIPSRFVQALRQQAFWLNSYVRVTKPMKLRPQMLTEVHG